MIKVNETIIKRYIRKKSLFEAQIEMTNRCNLNCVHCLRDKNINNELTINEIKKNLNILVNINCNRVIFTGGEPLLREDIFDIIRYAIKKRFITFLFTNGINITSENIKYFTDSNLFNIQISLFGITAMTHDSITQKEGSFKKTMQAIYLLKKYNVHFLVVVMVMNLNFHEIEALRRKADMEGWEILFDFVINPCLDGSTKPLRYRLTNKELKEAAKNGLLKRTYDLGGEKVYKFFEIFGRSYVYVSSEGKVMPYLTMREEAGNLRKNNFMDIWIKSEVLNKFRKLKASSFECYNCRYSSIICRGNPGLAYLEEGSLFKRPKEMCRIMRYLKENSQSY